MQLTDDMTMYSMGITWDGWAGFWFGSAVMIEKKTVGGTGWMDVENPYDLEVGDLMTRRT